ncbi:MAG: HEAT repeat domain-containing protein, partial [Candidatus Acidiferrum sp.]
MRFHIVYILVALFMPHNTALFAQAENAASSAKSIAPTTASDEALLREAKIATDGPGLFEFLHKRTMDLSDENRLKALIVKLGDDKFAVREQATAQLIAAGARARTLLQKATSHADLEISTRAQDCLRKIEEGATASVVCAAVRLIGQRKPAGAVEMLLAYLPAAEDERVAEEVRAVLAGLAVTDGKADPLLLAALTDKQAVKRYSAAVILSRCHVADQMPAVRRLLKDPDAAVQHRVGLALALAGEKEAVPV